MSTFVELNATDRLRASTRSRSPELLGLHRPEAAKHMVQFYENDSVVVENVAYLAEESLRAGNPAILIATRAHLDSIAERLTGAGLDLKALGGSGLYVALDAPKTLAQFMVKDWPDPARFQEIVGGLVGRAIGRSADGFAFAFGEMVALLCASNRAKAAVRLEQMWNTLAESYRFSLCCAYPLDSFGASPDVDLVWQICAEHSITIPAESPF
jgi:hypothetical protein